MRRIAAKPAGGCLRHTGHSGMSASCPLYPKKQTLVSTVVMSVLCQFETLLDYLVGDRGAKPRDESGLKEGSQTKYDLHQLRSEFLCPTNSVQRGEFIN